MDASKVKKDSGGRPPSPGGIAVHLSQEHLGVMSQRRELELKDELKQIQSLGMVDRLKETLDARLGRNLAMKRNNGPLEKKKRRGSRSHSFKRRKLMQSKGLLFKSVVGHEAMTYGNEKVASLYQKQELDQMQELKDIESLSVVQKRSSREMLSGHIASLSKRATTKSNTDNKTKTPSLSQKRALDQEQELRDIERLSLVRKPVNREMLSGHIARLSNHRFIIKSNSSSKTGPHGTDRKKSTVLVTSMEEDETYVREMHRQQSRAFIETMIQCPSRHQRVLEKLSTEQKREISKAAKNMKKGMSWSGEEGKVQNEQHPLLPSPPPLPPLSTKEDAIPSSLSLPPRPLDLMKGQLVKCTGIDHVLSGRLQSDGSSVAEAPSRTLGSNEEDEDKDALDAVQDVFDGDMRDFEESAVKMDEVEGYEDRLEQSSASTTVVHGDEVKYFSAVEVSSQSHILRESSQEPLEQAQEDDDTLSWAESSLDGSQLSLDTTSPPLHVSHPNTHLLPLSMQAGHTPNLMGSLGGRMTGPSSVHGTYGKVDMEFNPFAHEFRKGPRPEDSVGKVSQFPTASNRFSSSRPTGPQRSTSGHFFSPTPILSPSCSDGKTIPSKAFKDIGFLRFINELDREPVLSDYITYRMRVIGDDIEKKYSRELNQAMDEVFYEVIKQSLTWNTFKAVSTRLLVGGARIQDSILLVPCFARRLVDLVPQMGGRIADYTEEMLDNYATDSILGMGGWSSFMESYDSFEGGDEYVGVGTAVDPECDQPPMLSPTGHGYASLPTRRRPMTPKSQSLDVDLTLPDPEVSVTQSLSERPSQPPALSLRRWNSVEVLFPENHDDEKEDIKENVSSLHPPQLLTSSYSRSVSVSSLDLASPSASPRLASLSYKRMDSRSSVLNSRFGLSPLPEEDFNRGVSRRSSVCSIVVAGYNTSEYEYEVTDSGFEVIGRPAKPDSSKEKEATDDSKKEEYPENSSPSLWPFSAFPLRTDSGSTSTSDGDQVPRERRRSSADIVAPLVVITAHAVAFSCYILNQ